MPHTDLLRFSTKCEHHIAYAFAIYTIGRYLLAFASFSILAYFLNFSFSPKIFRTIQIQYMKHFVYKSHLLYTGSNSGENGMITNGTIPQSAQSHSINNNTSSKKERNQSSQRSSSLQDSNSSNRNAQCKYWTCAMLFPVIFISPKS